MDILQVCPSLIIPSKVHAAACMMAGGMVVEERPELGVILFWDTDLHRLEVAITQIIYFHSHTRRRQHQPTTEATTRTHHYQPMLSAYAERKQAGIISISLLTTDEHR